MSQSGTTVEVPADARIKQLAHDVHREGNEEIVPLLLDFYEFVSELDEKDHSTYSDLDIDNPESELDGTAWRSMIDNIESADIIERHPGGETTFTRE
jgi:hypothetical protein